MASLIADFREHPESTALAFRGYNITNLGRTPELLEHPVYQPIVERWLREASELCGDATGQRVDLMARVREKRETQGLKTYAEDVALIVGVELAQVEILRNVFDFDIARVQALFGYSLGEPAAICATGVFSMQDLMRAPLVLSDDVVALAEDLSMGVLFSRGPALDYGLVERLCLEITQQGKGTIAISAYLSPNSVLLLGQGATLEEFKNRMAETFPDQVHLRKNSNRWPPLHTSIMWQRHIPNRAAVAMQGIPGGLITPHPPIISMVTGKLSYATHNTRDILHQWIDHPQRLWDVMTQVLSMGVRTIVHVGPEPNLIPATFKRLSDNINAQMAGRSWSSFGLRAVSHIARRPWLSNLLTSRRSLLRAPFVQHVILEDWLLAQKVS